jgi:hypothetical protein
MLRAGSARTKEISKLHGCYLSDDARFASCLMYTPSMNAIAIADNGTSLIALEIESSGIPGRRPLSIASLTCKVINDATRGAMLVA